MVFYPTVNGHAVWPHVGVKKSPNFHESYPKGRCSSTNMRVFQIAQKVANCLGYFCVFFVSLKPKNRPIWSHWIGAAVPSLEPKVFALQHFSQVKFICLNLSLVGIPRPGFTYITASLCFYHLVFCTGFHSHYLPTYLPRYLSIHLSISIDLSSILFFLTRVYLGRA